jgi:hypothetical protein
VKRDLLYHRVMDALGGDRCPICAIAAAATDRYLRGILHEQVNDPELRAALARSKGFCATHAWALPRAGDALGAAILYEDQIEAAIVDVHHTLRALEPRGRQARRRADAAPGAIAAALRERRKPGEPCPACRIGDAARRRALTTLVASLEDPQFRQALESSPFLCLPDLALALDGAAARDARVLLVLAEYRLRRLKDELAELIRKRDYRFLHEPRGPEQTAWLRAIGQLVGWAERRE